MAGRAGLNGDFACLIAAAVEAARSVDRTIRNQLVS
jgi:hypothetical protein